MGLEVEIPSAADLMEQPAFRAAVLKLSSLLWQAYILGMTIDGDAHRARGGGREGIGGAHPVQHAYNRLVAAFGPPLAAVAALVPPVFEQWPALRGCALQAEVYDGPEEETGRTRAACIQDLWDALAVWRADCGGEDPNLALLLLEDDLQTGRWRLDVEERATYNGIVSMALEERYRMAVADVHLVSAQDVEMYAPWQAAEAALWSQHMGQRAAMEMAQAALWASLWRDFAATLSGHARHRLIVQEELQRAAVLTAQQGSVDRLLEEEMARRVAVAYALTEVDPPPEEPPAELPGEAPQADNEEEPQPPLTDPRVEAGLQWLQDYVAQHQESLFGPRPIARPQSPEDIRATLIQAHFRRWRVQRAVAALEAAWHSTARSAATRVQTRYRGFAARRRFAVLLVLYREAKGREALEAEAAAAVAAFWAAEDAAFRAIGRREAARRAAEERQRLARAAVHANQNLARVGIWDEETTQFAALCQSSADGVVAIQQRHVERQRAERLQLNAEEAAARADLTGLHLARVMDWVCWAKHLAGAVALYEPWGLALGLAEAVETAARRDVAAAEAAALEGVLLCHDVRLLERYEAVARRRLLAKEAALRAEFDPLLEEAQRRDQLRRAAAGHIQRVYRGAGGRRRHRALDDQRQRLRAAALLQRVGRGRAPREALAATAHCQRREKALRRLLQGEEAAARGGLRLELRSVYYNAAVRLQSCWRRHHACRKLARLKEFRDELSIVVRAERIERQWLLWQEEKGRGALAEERVRNAADVQHAHRTVAALRAVRQERIAQSEAEQRRRHAVEVLRTFACLCARKRARRRRQREAEARQRREEVLYRRHCAEKIWSVWQVYRFNRDLRPTFVLLRNDRRVLRQEMEQARRGLRQSEAAVRSRYEEWLEVMTGRAGWDDEAVVVRVQGVDFVSLDLEERLARRQLFRAMHDEREQLRREGKDYRVDAAFWPAYWRAAAASRIAAFRRAVVERRRAARRFATLQEQHFVARAEARARTALARAEHAAWLALASPDPTSPGPRRFSLRDHPLQAMAQSVQRVAEAARPALDPEKQRLKVKARMEAQAGPASSVRLLAAQLQGARNEFYGGTLAVSSSPTRTRKGRVLPALPAARAWEAPALLPPAVPPPASRHGLLPSLPPPSPHQPLARTFAAGGPTAGTDPSAPGRAAEVFKPWVTM